MGSDQHFKQYNVYNFSKDILIKLSHAFIDFGWVVQYDHIQESSYCIMMYGMWYDFRKQSTVTVSDKNTSSVTSEGFKQPIFSNIDITTLTLLNENKISTELSWMMTLTLEH